MSLAKSALPVEPRLHQQVQALHAQGRPSTRLVAFTSGDIILGVR